MEPTANTDKYSPKWVLWLKSTIRPSLTYIFTALYIYVFIHRSHIDPVYINGLNTIMITIIIFWYGERLLRNIGVADYLSALSRGGIIRQTTKDIPEN